MTDHFPGGENTATVTYTSLGKRVLFTILFVMILHLLASVLGLLVLFELAYAALTQRPPHARVTLFARRVLRYAVDIGQYITWNTEDLPFPLEELPQGAESRDANFSPSR